MNAARGLLVWVLAVAAAGPAAAIDLTGDWTLHLVSSPPEGTRMRVDESQNGTYIWIGIQSPADPLNGPFDSTTGAFSVSGLDVVGLQCLQMVGTGSPDGNAMSGTFQTGTLTCDFRPPGNCSCPFTSESPFTATRGASGLDFCGDGIVGPTEACDGGPSPGNGCCDSTCHVAAPAGTPCIQDSDLCTRDLCDAVGTCTHVSTGDTDGDGICDANDPCPAGVPVSRASVNLTGFTTTLADDKLTVRGTLRFAASPAIDPVHEGIRVTVADGAGGSIVANNLSPGAFDGTRGWIVHGSSFHYRAPASDADPFKRVDLVASSRTPGQFRVAIRASGLLRSAAPPLPLSAMVALDPFAQFATCGDLRFPGPPPAPSCVLRGGTIRCR